MRSNERTDKRVAQYYSLYFWLFSTIVHYEQQKSRLVPSFGNAEPFTDEQTDSLLYNQVPRGTSYAITSSSMIVIVAVLVGVVGVVRIIMTVVVAIVVFKSGL